MAARADVVSRWAALSTLLDDAEWTAALSDAALQVDATTWGARADLATCHLTAHALFLSHPELAPSGPVQSESVGGVSRSYAVAATQGGSSYAATAPGREYLRLRSQLGLGVMVI